MSAFLTQRSERRKELGERNAESARWGVAPRSDAWRAPSVQFCVATALAFTHLGGKVRGRDEAARYARGVHASASS